MSAASGAFAYDYEWSVPANLGETGAVEGTNDKLNYDKDNNTLSFEATAGDQVLVTVYNSGSTKGTVSANGTSIEVEGMATSVLDYTSVAGGPVAINFGGTIVVKSIKVISTAYKRVKAAADAAQQKVNDINIELAHYAGEENGKYADFYSALMKELNAQAQEIEQVRKDLKAAKEGNTVADEEAALTGRLTNVETNVAAIPGNAEAAVNQYKAIAETYAQTTTNQIKKARKTADISATEYANGAINDKPVYIYNFNEKKNNLGIITNGTKGDIKAAWETQELKTIETAQKQLAADALAELAKYPEHFTEAGKTVTEFQTAYDKVGTDIENMISRARVEYLHKADIEALAKEVEALDKIIAENPQVFTKPANYDTWAQGVKYINEYIAKTDNREEKTWAELQNDIVGAYNTANADLATMKSELANAAAAVLQPLFEETQNELSDKSYKITAKYQNEPETQKEWQKKFAVLQTELTGYGEKIANRDYATIVLDYTTFKAKIENVAKTVQGYWGETIKGQKGEVVSTNQAQADELKKQIADVRSLYNDRITNHIQKWLDQPFMTGNQTATTDVKNNLQKLFAIVGDLETVSTSIDNKIKALTETINGVEEVAFDPSDNKYRFFANDAEYTEGVKYTTEIANLKAQIESEIKDATFTANNAAYAYLNDYSWKGSAYSPNINSASDYVTDRKNDVDTGYRNSEMSQAAATAYKGAYEDVRTARYDAQNKQITLGYITLANAYVASHWCATKAALDYTKHTLADDVEMVQNDYLKPVYTEVDNITMQLNSYKSQYAQINDMKVKWNFAHANETKLQQDAKDANPNVDANFVATTVETMNGTMAQCAKDLEDNALNAKEQQPKTDEAVANFEKDYLHVTEYAKVFANDNNYAKATAKVAEVENAIKAAENTIAAYRDEVKAEAQQSLDNLKQQLSAQKGNIERDNANNDLGSTYGTIENALNSISESVKTVLDNAKSEQEGGNLDKDGDGTVGISDVDYMADELEDGKIDSDTFYNFIDAYLKYISNKK